MLRKFAFGIALAAIAGFTIGCDTASTKKPETSKVAIDKAKAGVDTTKEMADKAAETLRTDTLKPITEKMDAIKVAVGKLTGEPGTKATTALADLSKMVDAFKAASLDKVKDLVAPLQTKFTEVSKMAGM